MAIRNLLVRSCLMVQRRYAGSKTLKEALTKKIPEEIEKIKKFRKDHGKTKVGEVTVNMIYGGMRGIKGLLCETSHLDPQEGIRFRGYTIPEVCEKLPKADDSCQPLPEALFWLLCTGKIPTDDQVRSLSEEWALRSELPPHVCKFLRDCDKSVHPMAQLAAACNLLSTESQFVQALNSGAKKAQYWESTYEDCMNLIAKVSPISAIIYRHTFQDSHDVRNIDTSKDWSYNFCHMLCFEEPEFIELIRLYMVIHSDHEGGNVSAHTCHLVGSALSDPFISYAAAMNGLAGPLHGLANQEVLNWLEKIIEQLGEDPTEDQLKDFVNETLKTTVIPGYGHAVLRKTDPRYVVQREFALEHLPDDPMFKCVSLLYKVVPPILEGLGKVQNPWPNVDAHSGVLLRYYGLVEKQFYTVLFGMSRCLGVMASLIWSRALGLPIERPKSITTKLLMKEVAGGGGAKGKSSEDKKKIKIC